MMLRVRVYAAFNKTNMKVTSIKIRKISIYSAFLPCL